MIGKEGYIAAFEELVDEYLEQHPDASTTKAEAFADRGTWERYQDNLADFIDEANDTTKEFRI